MTIFGQPPQHNEPDEGPLNIETEAGDPAESALGAILGHTQGPVPDLCQGVMARLFASTESPLPCQYDVEFISTYVDQALSVDFADPVLLAQRIESFESHLPHCASCCCVLGTLTELQNITRGLFIRAEGRLEATGFSVATQVMAQYAALQMPEQVLDEETSLPLWGCGLVPAEEASYALDVRPDHADRLLIESHAQGCAPCNTDFSALAQTKAWVQSYQQAHLSQDETTPSLWPKVKGQLKSSKVVWFKRPWVVASSVAAAFLVFGLVNMNPGGSSPSVALAPINVQALEAALQADQADKALAEKRSGVINANYQTPESYLYDAEGEDDLFVAPSDSKPCDVSAMILQEP